MKLIEKTLRYGGVEERVFFRELTAGQQLQLAKGQKFKTTQKDGGAFEVDLGEQLNKNYQLVQMTLVTQDEQPVYPKLEALLKEPRKKIAALVKLATEVNADEEEEPAGNA
jgi:hypothetical protein